MGMVREIVPGIFVEGKRLFLCPGCGMVGSGGNPLSEEDVTMWVFTRLWALNLLGAKGCETKLTEQIVFKWFNEGGLQQHEEGHGDASRN